MKNLFLSVAVLLTSTMVIGQKSFEQQNGEGSGATLIPLTFHGISTPLGTFVEAPGTVNEITKTEKIGYHPKNDWGLNPNVNPNALPNGEDPVLQKQYAPPAPPTKTITQNWAGMGYTGVNPADPSVDVGPNHVVQMINGGSGAYIQVYSKTGTPMGGQVYFDNFMGMPGGAGDPIVMYDERADRWFLSEFSNAGNNLHIAISQTPDPTGAYYTYSTNSPGGFPDYPKYSIWEDAYVMTANVGTPDIYAFDRNSMLTGGASNVQMFSQSNFGTIGFQASTPVSMNGTTPPPTGQPALLMRMRDDAWAGAATDALEMWELDIDWAVPGNSTLAQVQTIGVSPHETELCGYTSFSCIPQPSGSNALDPLRELLMNRIHYRNFGSHESIVCCHVTDEDGADHAGIRWYELRRLGGTGGTWTIHQEGTYAPDSDHRWMPSIGISATGNIGLAYSVSSSTTFPSLRYTGRKECDALGVMTEPETTIIAGTASNASNRWGDYFQMGTDPSDGETFWHTGCYNVSTQWSTRVSAFDIGTCSPTVSFGASTFTVNEPDADQPNGCLPYAIVNVPISIGVDPSQAADVTVNVTGGTATNNVDYAIQNNVFSFDNPTLSGIVVIHVYDDEYIEGAETITLDYTLNANGGDATTGAFNQTVTITINDDDIAPINALNPTPVVLLTQDFESGFGAFSTNNPNGPDVWQIGLEAAAASGNFPYAGTNTTNIAWVNDDGVDADRSEVNLDFPSVDLSGYNAASVNFDSYFFGLSYNGFTETLELLASVSGGPFNYVASAVNGNTGAADYVSQVIDVTSLCGNNDVVFRIQYSDAGDWLYGAGIDDVSVEGQTGIDIQQAVNTGAGMTANLGGNETVHFYDPVNGDVMATLTNTSGFDYGCVTVEVDRSGTNATVFNSAVAADFLTDKTYTIVPTNTNPAGTFDVTLYYKEAEVAGWEAATGNSRNNAEIIKVAGNNAIQDVNPGNAGSFTIDNSAAALGAFYSDVTFTAPFSTGFSGFGVGIYNAVTGTPPVADFSGSPTTICAGQSVSFTDLSTNTPTSWSWNFGDSGTSTAQSPSHVYNTAGTYTVSLTATNADGSDMYSITDYIVVNALPSVSATGTSTICNGQSATITASGASTYLWDQGLGAGSSQVVSPSSTTTYTVTGTDGNGCTNTDAVVITVNPLPTVSASGSATICAGQSTSISASGATTYSWDNGLGAGANQSVSPSSTTTYTVTGTTSGCSNTDQVTITVTPLPNVVATGTTSICNGSSTSISATGATTYSWDNGLGAGSSHTVSPTSTTTYTVTGTASGCVNTDAVTVTVNANPTISVASANNPTTCATATGSITVNGSGVGNVSWSGTASGTATGVSMPYTIMGLAAGSYNITYVDGNGCTSNTLAQSLTDPSAPTVVAAGTTTICAGQSTVISASGATTYTWDNGLPTGSSHTVSPLVTTTYNVTGTTSGCSNNDAVTITVTPSPTISAGLVTNPATCGSATGSIEVAGSGTGDVSWSGTSSGSATGVSLPYTITGLTSGSYTLTFTDGTGCTSNSVVQALSDPSAPTVTASGTTTICAGQSTSISASGASTYVWDNGLPTGASHTVAPTVTTTYNVTGTTAGCSDAASVTITVTPLPNVTATGTATICDGSSTVIDGSGATTYSWDQGLGAGSSQTVSPSSTTTYTVTGTTSGCSNTDQVTITVNAIPTVTATGTASICQGNSTPIAASGASTYVWDNGLGTNASQNVSPSSTTTYTVVGTDGSGCSNNAAVTVTVIPTPVISVLSSTNPATCGSTTGSIIIGGTGTGDVTWTGASSGTAVGVSLPYTITGLTAGSYAATFTNAAGCVSNTEVQVLTDPSGPAVTASATSTNICVGQSTSITGAGASSYSWDNGLGAGATQAVSPVTTTTYIVTGTDLSNCSSVAQVTIIVNALPTVVATGTTSICEGGSTTIDASGAVTYNWNNGIGSGATQPVSPTTTTTYTVTGTDANGCSNTDQVTITVNALPSIVANGATWICVGETTTIDATGASTYSWDNGLGSGASHSVAPSATTTYTVTGTDGNGCANTDQVTVTVNALPNVVATGTTSICEGSSAPISASGASSYSWDNGLGSGATHSVSPSTTTTYIVTGVDGNGCTNTDQVTVTVDPLPTVSVSPAVVDTMCRQDGTLTIIGSPSGGTLSGPGVTGNQFDPNTAGAGSHTISYDYTDGNGCSNSVTVSIVVEDCAGIEENALIDVDLFPNPNDGHFTIKGLPQGTEFTIYDDRGREIMSSSMNSEKEEIVLPVVQSGVYYLRAKVNGKEGSLKFLIAR